jgi:hypothetical protein
MGIRWMSVIFAHGLRILGTTSQDRANSVDPGGKWALKNYIK